MKNLFNTILLAFIIGLFFCFTNFAPVVKAQTGATAPTAPTTPAAPTVASPSGTGSGEGATGTGSTSEGFGVGATIPGHGVNYSGYTDWIAAFYDFSTKLGAILTLLMLIFAGYKYMTSQGNPTAINEAKDILIGSLSGYALLLLVALILNVLQLRG